MTTKPTRFMCACAGRYTTHAGCIAMPRPSVIPATNHSRLARMKAFANGSTTIASPLRLRRKNPHSAFRRVGKGVRDERILARLLQSNLEDSASADGDVDRLHADESRGGGCVLEDTLEDAPDHVER